VEAYDLAFEVDELTNDLRNAISTLLVLTEAIEMEAQRAKDAAFQVWPAWLQQRCCGYYVLCHELSRITEALETMVTTEFEARRGSKA